MSEKKSLMTVTVTTENGNKSVFRVNDSTKIQFILSVIRDDAKAQVIPIPKSMGKAIVDALDAESLKELKASALRIKKSLSFPSESEAFEAGEKAWEEIHEFKKAYCVDNSPLETSAHRAGWMGCYRWLIKLLHPNVKIGPSTNG